MYNNTNEMFPDFPSQFQFFDHVNVQTFSPPPHFSIPISSDELHPFPALRSEFSHSSSGGVCSSFTSPTNQYGYASPSSTPLRRRRNVFSTGDLQVQDMNVEQYSNSNSNRSDESPPLQHDLSIIGGMTKACKYSPEEKKDKIQRYRTKRNQRNFNKKIKYECRKTLADSRQRIRGRFARNDEIDKNFPNDQWDQEDENWVTFLMQQYQQQM